MEIPESVEPLLLPELRAWMTQTDTHQRDLARLLGWSESQFSRYLSGEQPLPMRRAIKLSLVTNIPIMKLNPDAVTTRLAELLVDQQNTPSDIAKDNDNVA